MKTEMQTVYDNLASVRRLLNMPFIHEDNPYNKWKPVYVSIVEVHRIDDALNLLEKMKDQRCNRCEYYEGVKNIQGHAPCSKWNIGGVLWDDCCPKFELAKMP